MTSDDELVAALSSSEWKCLDDELERAAYIEHSGDTHRALVRMRNRVTIAPTNQSSLKREVILSRGEWRIIFRHLREGREVSEALGDVIPAELDRLDVMVFEMLKPLPHQLPLTPPWRSPLRQLRVDTSIEIPEIVREEVDAALAASQVDDFLPRHVTGHIWWDWRSGVVDDRVAELLTDSVRPVPLPNDVVRIWEAANEISSIQAHMLAAALLREHDPIWWAELPWHDVEADSRDLNELTPLEGESSGQARLVASTQGETELAIAIPDLPNHWDANEQGRLLVAAASVLHRFGGTAPVGWTALTRACEVCGAEFYQSSLWLNSLLFAGAGVFCRSCVDNAVHGGVAAHSGGIQVDEVASNEALTILASRLGGPPGQAQVFAPLSLEPLEDRALLITLRMALPTRRKAWGKMLNAAGLVPDGWRPSFGTYNTATDGHPCRSLFERHIDDWFHASGVLHELEPQYPIHAELNTNGLKRADWLLGDGTYVEAAGILSERGYREKLEIKARLAEATGIRLIILTPSDLPNLRKIFRN